MVTLSVMASQQQARSKGELLYESSVKCKTHPISLRITATNQCYACVKAEYRKHKVTFQLS